MVNSADFSQEMNAGLSADLITPDMGQVSAKLGSGLSMAQDLLTEFAQSTDFEADIGLTFGDSYDQAIADSIMQRWKDGEFGAFPEIEVLSSEVMGDANGAFATATGKIYLADDFLINGGLGEIVSVIVEETGHYMDSQINVSDAEGDEGEIFAYVVQGIGLSEAELGVLRSEDDSGVINIGGVDVLVEAYNPPVAFTKQNLTDWQIMKGDLTNIIIGDFNGDGRDDFIRQEKGAWDNDHLNTAHIYLSNGNGTFWRRSLTHHWDMKGDLTNIIVGDFNGDGRDDFIRQEKWYWDDDNNNTANVYLSNGNGTFWKQH